MKTDKNIHAEPVTVGKKKLEKKREKKNQKKENEERYEHFFVFTDFWVLGLLHVLLSCCYILLL